MNYKLFGRSGLRVSELCLGTMGLGTGVGIRQGDEQEDLQHVCRCGWEFH